MARASAFSISARSSLLLQRRVVISTRPASAAWPGTRPGRPGQLGGSAAPGEGDADRAPICTAGRQLDLATDLLHHAVGQRRDLVGFVHVLDEDHELVTAEPGDEVPSGPPLIGRRPRGRVVADRGRRCRWPA
jgi:hypothetical protein